MQSSVQLSKVAGDAAFSADFIEAWRRNIKASTFANYHLEMGRALQKQGAVTEAVAALSRAIETYPQDQTARVELSELLHAAGRTAEAEALDRDGQHADPAYRERQAIRWLNSRTDLAPEQEILHIDEAARRFAPSTDLDLWKAAAWLELGQDAGARRLYTETDLSAVREPKLLAERQERAGNQLFLSMQLERARLPFAVAVQLDPTLWSCWERLSSLELARGNWMAAMTAVQEIFACGSKQLYFHSQMALIQLGQGNVDAAEQSLKEFLKVAPEHFHIKARFALIEAARGQIEAALAILHNALAIQPDDFWLNVDKAVFSDKAGDRFGTQEALDTLVRVHQPILETSLMARPWASSTLTRLLAGVGQTISPGVLDFMRISH